MTFDEWWEKSWSQTSTENFGALGPSIKGLAQTAWDRSRMEAAREVTDLLLGAEKKDVG